jgi:aspartate/methionine/tyrosine aminotransferase
MLAEFKERRDIIIKLLNASGHFECRTPSGAFYVFPKYKADIPSEKFAENLLTKAKVAVTAGSAFGKAGEGHIRISYAASRENIKEGVRHIVSSLE